MVLYQLQVLNRDQVNLPKGRIYQAIAVHIAMYDSY